jgi:ectoine hydroxylase-related dioxygenase (phytanoyl-CoA dioxygenase family)
MGRAGVGQSILIYLAREKPMPTVIEQASPWLQGRPFASWREQFDARGYLIFEHVLAPGRVAELRDALAPHLARDLKGRNDFEGVKTNRVYALLAKSPHFAELAIHPLALAFAEAELGESCLLSAMLAINLLPGETVQPWHTDDGGVKLPRPRPAFGVSTFWAIDDTTALNGATEIVPGSHLWDDQRIEGAAKPSDFIKKATDDADPDSGDRADAVKLVMPSGSLAITKGTLWHRGGANRSERPRLIITPQYCAGWVRQLENMALAVPAEVASDLPERARELIGYSIHPPFMGYVDGVHPRKLLRPQAV